MSYAKMMRWHKKHPKGGKIQPCLMSTSSGFWPAHAWLVEDYEPYIANCKANGITPMGCKEYYDYQVANRL